MKTAILTFQFAHNYGALLQAYALKQYLKSHDLEGEIAPYYPDWAQSEYAISPFAKGVSFRRRVRLASQYWKRKGQSRYLISLFQRNWMQVIHFRPKIN